VPQKRDKTTGLPLPSPVVPATNLCVQMIIPNDPLYVQAFRGVLADLGKYWTWHQVVGQDNSDAQVAAEMWRDRLQFITISEDCEDPVSCADVTNCITSNGGTRDAIRDLVVSSDSVSNPLYQQSVTGVEMTPAQRGAPIGTPPDCDLDILFAMVTTIVDKLNTNNTDFLEIWEAASNETERAEKVISAIPVIGLLPIDEILGFIDQIQEEIKENYQAEWTDSLRDEIRCAIFCLVKDQPECIISFDTLIDYFNGRLSVYLDPLATLEAIVQYFIAGTWAGTTVVDIMMVLQLGIWRAASNFLGVNIRSLQLVAKLVWDNPDPDWELLCTDCSTPVSALQIEPYPGWEAYCAWEFIGLDGTDEIWEVRSLAGGGEGSFTGRSATGTYFYVISETITEGSFTNVRETASPTVQTPAPFDPTILVTVYLAAFWLTLPAKMRVTLRPA